MALTKQIKYKDSSGNDQLVDIGVDAKNVESNTFSQATARANLASGDKLPTIFGKLMKWFADLKTVAWTGSYNDLTNKPTMGGITGTVAVTQGGTGATTASQARVNLGVGAAGTYSVANNCTTTAAGYALDARQGKALMDKANQISSDLSKGLNGCKITYEGGEFYGTYGSVKKKFNPALYVGSTRNSMAGSGMLQCSIAVPKGTHIVICARFDHYLPPGYTFNITGYSAATTLYQHVDTTGYAAYVYYVFKIIMNAAGTLVLGGTGAQNESVIRSQEMSVIQID